MGKETTKTIFLDIGGVLLTNGWDRAARAKACETFHLDNDEMNERHHLTFDTYEEGKLNLDEYLSRVVFYQPRSFTPEEFKDFMFAQSQPFPLMIDLIKQVKRRYGLKVATISNEGYELTMYRIRKFELDSFIDFFISSCFVHYRKPDADIFHIALNVAQVSPSQSIYIEDRPLFVDVACGLGINAIRHIDAESTRAVLAENGFPV
ncbi:MAG: HAD family hydrolase [Omnitrophica WOR_2 bacterium]